MLAVTSSTSEDHKGRSRTVIRVEGDVSMSSLPRFVDSMNRELATCDTSVILVDLDAVDGIDDAGLGILLGFAARARNTNRRFGIVASAPSIRGRLADTRLDHAVDVFGSLLDAGRMG